MAASDPAESHRPATDTSEDVDESGQVNKSKSGGAVDETAPREAKEKPADSQGQTVARVDGSCVSHSEVSEVSGGGTSRATRKSADEQKPVEHMQDAPIDFEMQEKDGEETKRAGMQEHVVMYFLTSISPEAKQAWGSTLVLG